MRQASGYVENGCNYHCSQSNYKLSKMDEFGNRILDACKDAFPSTPDPTFVASVPPHAILLYFVLKNTNKRQ